MPRPALPLALATLAAACSAPPVAAPPATPSAAPQVVAAPRLPACVAEDAARGKALAALAAGKLDRGLRWLDDVDARCPGEARRTAVPRLRALAQGGRVDAATALAATLANGDAAERAAATEAKQILATLPAPEAAIGEALGLLGKDPVRAQRLLDRARFAYEREAGAPARIDELSAAGRGGKVRWSKLGIFEAQATRVVLFDADDLAPRRVFELGEAVVGLSVAADVVVAAGATRTRVWSAATGAGRDLPGVAAPIALGGDGVLLAAVEPKSKDVVLTPLSGPGSVRRIKGTKKTLKLALSPDTERLAVHREGDPFVEVYLTKTAAPYKKVDKAPEASMTFGPDSDRLYFGGWHDIHWVSVDKGTTSPVATNKRVAVELAFHPKGLQLASAGTLTVRLWDPVTLVSRNAEGSMKGHTDAIVSVDFSPDGDRLVTSSSDGTLRVWDPMVGKAVRSHTAFRPRALSAASPTRWVVAAPSGDALDIDLATGLRASLPLGAPPLGLALAKDRLLVTTPLGQVSLWSLASHTRIFERSEGFRWADFDGNGAPRAFQQPIGVHWLDPSTGATVGEKPVAATFGVSPNGRYAIVRTLNRAALWDFETQKSKVLDKVTPEWIAVLDWSDGVFSADSKVLYLPWRPYSPKAPKTLGPASVVRAYATATGEVLSTFDVGTHVEALALGDEGTLLVGTGQGVEVWDRTQGTRVRSVDVPGGVTEVFAGPKGGFVERGRDGRFTLVDAEGQRRLLVVPASKGWLFVDRDGSFTTQGDAAEVRCVIGTHVLPRVVCDERYGVDDVVRTALGPPSP